MPGAVLDHGQQRAGPPDAVAAQRLHPRTGDLLEGGVDGREHPATRTSRTAITSSVIAVELIAARTPHR